ncbi:MAG: hypothetical protein ACM3XN_06165 [Chloroflexota bacterium]
MLTWRTAAGTVMASAILLLLIVHTLPIPGVTVDQTTIGLLIMMAVALLLPDLTKLVGPGGWEADFQRNIGQAERELAQAPPPARDPAAPAGEPENIASQIRPRWPLDAGLQLAHLRVALEDRLRRLTGADDGTPLEAVLERLTRQRRISSGMQRSCAAFIKASDAYLCSRRTLIPASVTRALAIGEELLRRLTAPPGGV